VNASGVPLGWGLGSAVAFVAVGQFPSVIGVSLRYRKSYAYAVPAPPSSPVAVHDKVAVVWVVPVTARSATASGGLESPAGSGEPPRALAALSRPPVSTFPDREARGSTVFRI